MTSQWCHRNKTHSLYSELNSLQNVYFGFFFIFGKLTEWRCFVTYLSNDPRISQHNTKPPRPRPRPIFLVSDRSCPMTDGLRPYHWFGGALWAPQLCSGRSSSWPPKDFSLFSALRMASPESWHYNIVLLWIKNEKFLAHSILSQLLCILVMLFDVFLKY